MTDGVAGRRLRGDQPAAAGVRRELQRAVAGLPGRPRCLSFTVWGFTDRHSWVPGWFDDPPQGLATIYDENYQPKRAYQR